MIQVRERGFCSTFVCKYDTPHGKRRDKYIFLIIIIIIIIVITILTDVFSLPRLSIEKEKTCPPLILKSSSQQIEALFRK